MNEKINRNDPCPCGSGKKYKKCCGLNEVISISNVIEDEVVRLQHQLVDYALQHYEREIEQDYEQLEPHLNLNDESEQDFYLTIHTIWFTLFKEVDGEETILEKFIRYESKNIKRPKLKDILNTWTDVRILAGEAIDIDGNILKLKNFFTGETEEISLVNSHKVEGGKNSFIFGMAMPYEDKLIFIPSLIELTNLQPDIAYQFIEEKSAQLGYDSPEEGFNAFFMEIMNDLPSVGFTVEPDNLEWSAPVYQEVAKVFQKKMNELNESQSLIEFGILIWHKFCEKRQKQIKNPAVYAAALHYLISFIFPEDFPSTQKKVAEIYGVSAGSISNRYYELDEVLHDDIVQMLEESAGPAEAGINPLASEQMLNGVFAEIQEQGLESIEEIEEFLNKKINQPQKPVKKTSRNNKEHAQNLIYEAIEAQGIDRYKLALEALDLDPSNADAYNLAGEFADSPEEAAEIYKNGMEAAEKELGKEFFLENRGYFWGLIETRPYMRAKNKYAQALVVIGKSAEAASEYEAILELNPMDNQGVRYDLFPIYLELKQFDKAKALLKQFPEGSTHWLFNELLLELLEKGKTAKATRLLKKANAQNKYVIDYITEKKRLPKQMPEYYSWGDQNEAIIYAFSAILIWSGVEGLQEWIAKKK